MGPARQARPDLRLRQVALVARDLPAAERALADGLGLEATRAFRDPGVGEFGLVNAVWPLGDTFLEVVSPAREATAAGRFLERRGGDGGYMVLLQTDDLAASRARAGASGARVVWEVALPDIAAVHLHPRDLGGAIVSLDRPEPPASWRWGGPGWEARRAGGLRGIAAVELQGPDPEALAARWSAVLGRPAATLGTRLEIGLESGAIRFVADRDGRGEGVSGVVIAADDPDGLRARARERGVHEDGGDLVLCGTRFRLRAA